MIESTGALVLSAASGDDPELGGSRLERLGDFRVYPEVVRAGMGVTYESEQESLGQRVALEVLPSTPYTTLFKCSDSSARPRGQPACTPCPLGRARVRRDGAGC
jgi:hypothetical protein